MKRKIFTLFSIGALAFSAFAQNNNYGLPEDIQDGNILHCFNWSINDVKDNLENIAEAGFGAVQLSPLQRRNVAKTHIWSDVYRPYDFSFQASSALGTEADLKTLCTEAKKYGIKVIVDVVANHVDKASGYHDPWWNESGRVRSWDGNANINYGNRYSITHDRLGDYGEINSENPEVIARAKAYVQWLHDAGVSGIRWDAAKHIGLPSEGCDFWKEVTSVEGMFHYGEILGTPGPNNSKALIEEYARYMSVTDSNYADEAAKSNNGITKRKNGEWATIVGAGKLIYWGETHDTYSNTPDYGGWSSSKSQAMIDRAYAAMACRDGAAALYLSRPNASGYGNIKVVKGSDHYQTAAVAEVNKFRNKMNGRSEYFSASEDGSSVCITRNNGGAVIVNKSSGEFSVENGGGLCPVGTYTDRVSGNTVTVTATTISGKANSTGIVVIYNDDLIPADPNAPVQEYDDGSIKIYYDNSETGWSTVACHYWGSQQTTWPGIVMSQVEDNIYTISLPASSSVVFNNNGQGKQTVDVNNVLDRHLYKGLTATTSGKNNVQDMNRYVAGVFAIVSGNDNAVITTLPGHIYVAGAEQQNVLVVSADGKIQFNGVASETLDISVAPGIYIVGVKGQTRKIMVR